MTGCSLCVEAGAASARAGKLAGGPERARPRPAQPPGEAQRHDALRLLWINELHHPVVSMGSYRLPTSIADLFQCLTPHPVLNIYNATVQEGKVGLGRAGRQWADGRKAHGRARPGGLCCSAARLGLAVGRLLPKGGGSLTLRPPPRRRGRLLLMQTLLLKKAVAGLPRHARFYHQKKPEWVVCWLVH